MITLTTQQTNILTQNKPTISWGFEIGSYRYSTKTFTYDSTTYTAKIIGNSFNGITNELTKAEQGIIAPNEITFSIDNKNNTLDENDFKSSGEFYPVTIKLIIGATVSSVYTEDIFKTWTYSIKYIDDLHEMLTFHLEDPLTAFLDGDYPTTAKVSKLNPVSEADSDDDLCIPVPFGTAYVPLRFIYIASPTGSPTLPTGGQRYYVLGEPTAPTRYLADGTTIGGGAVSFTIDELHSPRDTAKSTYDSSYGDGFEQSTQEINSTNYRVFRAMIARNVDDHEEFWSGFWLPSGKFLDPIVKFTRSDTSSITNPADVIAYVLQDIGLDSTQIDVGAGSSFATTYSTFATWGLSFNYGFYKPETREKALANLLCACNSYLTNTDKIELHTFSATSCATLDQSDILQNNGQSSFRALGLNSTKDYDSAYVNYNETDTPQDELIKVIAKADNSTSDNIDTEEIQFPYIQNQQHAIRSAQLKLQRKYWGDRKFSFSTLRKYLYLQPGDVITVNHTRYGGTYTGIIQQLQIDATGKPTFTVERMKTGSLQAWSTVSPSTTAVVQPEDQPGIYQPGTSMEQEYSDGDNPANITGLNSESILYGARFFWNANKANDFDHFEYRYQISDNPPNSYSSWSAPWTETTKNYCQILTTSDDRDTYGTDAIIHIEVTAENTSGDTSLVTAATSCEIMYLTIAASEVDDFSVTPNKLAWKVPVLVGDSWTDHALSGTVDWNEHVLYYDGVAFTIDEGSTTNKYIYWENEATSYSTSSTHPKESMDVDDFMIAVNIDGVHDLAWNAIANQVIGSAYIQDAAITSAKINDLTASKLTAGTIDANEIDVINLNAANITTGFISADRIDAGTITFDMLSSNATPQYPHDTDLFAIWSGDPGTGTVIIDLSENGNDGDLINGVGFTNGIAGKSLTFNGTNQYIDVGVQGLSGAKTIAGWIKIDLVSWDTGSQSAYVIASDYESGAGYTLWIDDTTGKLCYTQYNASGSTTIASDNSLPVGEYVHVAVTFNGTNAILYVNGMADSTSTVMDNNVASSSNLYIAGQQNSGNLNGGLSGCFIFKIQTSGSSDTFTLPLVSTGTYDFNVDWGDGSDDDITVYNQAEVTHTYTVEDEYEIIITGTINGWGVNKHADDQMVTEISNFGCLQIGNAGYYFYGYTNVSITAIDELDVSSTTNFAYFFPGCADIPDVIGWDVSDVTSFSNMFHECANFNQDISGWDTSSATTMASMFRLATSFDQDISGFNISNVTDMERMFEHVTLSTANYNALLIGWAAQAPNIQSSVNFNAGSSQYTAGGAAATARAVLTGAPYSWTIYDGGSV